MVNQLKKKVNQCSFVVAGQQINIQPWRLGEQYYLNIIDRASAQLDAMLSYHSRVLVIRYDLHLGKPAESSELISQLFRKLRQRLKREHRAIRLGYAWCREQNLSKSAHYHLAVMVDGNKFRHSYTVTNLIDQIWTGLDQPVPYKPENHYYYCDREDTEVITDALQRIAYLAKVKTKGFRKPTMNDYSTSRLKPKPVLH